MMAENIGKLGSRFTNQAASSRRNSILVALLAAIVAGALIYAFVSHSNKNATATAPVESTVFVAKSYIPAGMEDSAIISQGLLKPEQIAATAVIAGALSDPSEVAGMVSTSAIAAGQQVTSSDFAKGSSQLDTQLRGNGRAVAISLDAAHGLTAYLTAGDTVDVAVQGPSGAGALFQNISVLANATGNVVLDLSDKQVLLLADALQENLSIWLELRPAKGATDSVKLGTVEKIS
jgi:Flp pilus assembly protein CpaB